MSQLNSKDFKEKFFSPTISITDSDDTNSSSIDSSSRIDSSIDSSTDSSIDSSMDSSIKICIDDTRDDEKLEFTKFFVCAIKSIAPNEQNKKIEIINQNKNKDQYDNTDTDNKIINICKSLNTISIDDNLYNSLLKKTQDKYEQDFTITFDISNRNLVYNHIYISKYILDSFVYFCLLIKDTDKDTDQYIFKLLNNKNLEWCEIKYLEKNNNDTNIKNNKYIQFIATLIGIKDSENLIYQVLLWFFRKVFVNCIVYDLVEYYKRKDPSDIYSIVKDFNSLVLDDSYKYNSVGSTNITSDYDITLQGSQETYISRIITKYKDIIKLMLYGNSDIIFDTNLYGVGFSKDVDLNYDCNFKCNNDKIKLCITNIHTDNDIYDQHTWAFVKMFSNDKVSYHDTEYYHNNDIIKTAIDFVYNNIKSYNNSNNYEILINKANFIKSQYGLNNFISIVNYYGSETYYTRGAFLDVVINQQTCKNNIQNNSYIDTHAFLDSFIENISDYCNHSFKTKYLDRALYVLNILQNNNELRVLKNNITQLYVYLEDKNNKNTNDIYNQTIELYLNFIKIKQINIDKNHIQKNIFNHNFELNSSLILSDNKYNISDDNLLQTPIQRTTRGRSYNNNINSIYTNSNRLFTNRNAIYIP